MKKLILMAAVMLASVGAYAQHAVGSFNIQPKVGLNIATLTEFDNTKAKIGFVGGVEGEYQVTDLFSLTGGVLYSQQGVKFDDGFSVGNFKKEDSKANVDYINIPILANVYVVKGLAVKLGVQPGFVVNDDDTNAKSFDFSIPVGVSYEYKNVQLDARYNWGLTKVYDFGSDSPKNSVFQITLGYKFDL